MATVNVRFNTSLLKKKIKQFDITLQELADVVGVSLPAVKSWCAGGVPKAIPLVIMVEYFSQPKWEPEIAMYDPKQPALSLLISKVSGLPAPPQPEKIKWT